MTRAPDALTNIALSHEEHCECIVCRGCAGERSAWEFCVQAYNRGLIVRRSARPANQNRKP